MSAADHPIGTTLLGRYAIRSHLGAGTSANVYLAEDLTLQRQVAVKLLLPGLANDEAFLKRFRAEAQVVAALNHPNVMRVFDWGEDVDGPFLVLEYLSGGSLKELEDRGIRLSPAQAATFGVQAAAGLAYAHERGLVHRDVKPANFMFDDEGRVRVTDFGVARALAEASWTEPVGSMIGTVRYASPEQASGATIDGRADVYALALVLFEAVTGSVPFAGDTQIAALMARVGAELPQLESLDALGPVIHAASAPEPELRIDARTMVGQLEAAVKQLPEPDPLPLHGLRAKPSSSIGFRPPSTDELTQSVPAATRRPQRSRSAGLYDQQADGRFDETVIGASGAVAIATPRRITRRRWILLAFMAALVTAGGIVLAIQEKVFTPSHPVPSLTMQTANEAQRTLAALHLTLTFGQSRYSLKIPVDHIVVQLPRAGASLKEGDSVRVRLSKGPAPTTVPKVAGLNCPAAKALLLTVSLTGKCPKTLAAYNETVPKNQVVSYTVNGRFNPASAPYKGTVVMTLSKGPTPISVPSVSGTYAQISSTLTAAGFLPTRTKEYSTTIPAGSVIRTSPSAGALLQKGQPVTVVMSLGPPMETIPNVNGLSASAAISRLTARGFKIGKIFGPPNGTVFSTTPAIGTSVQYGTKVNIYTKK